MRGVLKVGKKALRKIFILMSVLMLTLMWSSIVVATQQEAYGNVQGSNEESPENLSDKVIIAVELGKPPSKHYYTK